MNEQAHPAAYETDLYRKIQVHPKADPAVIDAAYKALLKLHAPRAIGDDDRIARELGEAHVILSDTRARRHYDDYQKTLVGIKKPMGPYRIVSKIAQGGFGTTYKAEHTRFGKGKFSCIKDCSEISAHANRILEEECGAIWDLRHFGLPIMRDLLTLEDGSHALVSSWIDGPTLQQVVERNGRMDPEHVAWITDRVLNTLSYLHHHQVLHGDIKPQNMIIEPKSHIVVLIDYGLSVVKPTATSGSKGHTELFSPPEQVEGKGPLVPGSDFYSLGMTMLYALGGNRSIERKEVPVEVPKAMRDFIIKLIVRDVLGRPRYAHELFEEFQKVRVVSFGRDHSNMKPLPVS